jgi:hypothetical protein
MKLIPNDGDVSEYEPEIESPHAIKDGDEINIRDPVSFQQKEVTERDESPDHDMKPAMSSITSRQEIKPIKSPISPFTTHLDLSLGDDSDS